MGLLTSALQVGRSAVLTYSAALRTVGNNITNAANPDYTRQSLTLRGVQGLDSGETFDPGNGVEVASLERHLDESLENRLRTSIGNVESSVVRQQVHSRLEPLFDDASGGGLAESITEFFNSFAQVQNTPEDIAIRELALSSGAALASGIQSLRTNINRLAEDVDDQISTLARTANGLAEEIADLNSQIARSEAGDRGPTSALRDRRDAKLRELSELVDVTVRIENDQSINVYIGSEILVQNGISRGLTTEFQVTEERVRTELRFADTGGPVTVSGGRLAGLIQARDEDVLSHIDTLDQLAAGVIAEVNRVHADGQGLNGFSTVTSNFRVLDPDVPLSDSLSEAAHAPEDGSFFIAVSDEISGTTRGHQINVQLTGAEDDTTLTSLVDQINGEVDGVTASVTADGRLQLTAREGSRITFGHDGSEQRVDTSGVLAALGVNSFFEGSSAEDIAVSQGIQGQPGLVAAASVNLTGDGANAGRLADAGDVIVANLNGISIKDFYARLATNIAVEGSNINESVEANDVVNDSLVAQKEQISGVSLDEEAIELIKFERAFQGASRYLSTINRLMEELLTFVR
jgi:flagellar hook-associated protein 1 FlgK